MYSRLSRAFLLVALSFTFFAAGDAHTIRRKLHNHSPQVVGRTPQSAWIPHTRPHITAPVNGYGNDASDRSSKQPDFLRGVNLGAWLVLEQWMVPDVFNGTNATDQWSFDQTPGAAAKLRKHWDTYITEQDIAKLSSWGINA